MPFIAKDIAILRLSVTNDGHLELSHENVNDKNGKFLLSPLGSIYVRKKQLFNIYMKQSKDVYLLHNCVYYIHVTVIVTHCLASITLFSFLSPK